MNKPRTIHPNTSLPPALEPLCQIAHWVLWRWEQRKDENGQPKWTKPPYMAAIPARNAKNNDPATWSDYKTAADAMNRANSHCSGRGFDGIGFALLDTPFAAVDLDHCLDPVSGEIDEWAKAWVTKANGCYVERTPSGEGLRIIGLGNGEKVHRKFSVAGAREGAAIEIYQNCERYITVTGAQVQGGDGLSQLDLLREIEAHYEARPKTRKAKSGAGKVDYDEIIRNGAPKGRRSDLFQSCVWHLAAKGMSLDEIVCELARHPNGIAQRYISENRLRGEVERSLEKRVEAHKISPAAEEPEEPAAWDTIDKNGVPKPTCTNARRAIRALGITCRYDAFHDRLLVEGKAIKWISNLDHLALVVRTKLHKAFRFDPGTKNTLDAIIQLCRQNEFDPVRDYLDALQWDDVSRLDRWLITYLGAEDTELNREFGRLALVAAVRRVRHPGSKFDPIIVLEGPMGTQKSMAIEIMAGSENFSDQTILGARDREAQELLAGVWLYEIAELSNIKRTEVEHIKAFASRTFDRARPAYGRTREDRPRRGVLFATTNNDRYLKEADRRFWPVKTGTIDVEALRRDRDQLWAEATAREPGASTVLRRELWETARVEQQAREDADPWDDVLVEAVGTVEGGEERVFSKDLLTTVIGIHPGNQRDIHVKRLGRCMRRLGWNGPKVIRIGDNQAKGYSR